MKRALFSALALGLVLSCAKDDAVVCKRCHMKITSTDPYRSVLVYTDGTQASFDSITCALRSYSSTVKTLRVHEYYSGQERDAQGLVFVQGSDVTGAMADDYLPVDPANVKKFETDHGMKRELKYDELFTDVNARK